MITVHHLNHSRSTRVLWLLEELSVEYQVIRYEREPGFRAPPALRAFHASGKAPIVELDGAVIGESAVILAAIEARYGHGLLAPPVGTAARLHHDEWLHLAEGSASVPLMLSLYGRLLGGLPDALDRIISLEANLVLDRVEGALRLQPFLTGSAISLADIQMAYTLDLAGFVGLTADRRLIRNYLGRLKKRPAFLQAIAVGGPMMPPQV